MWLTRCSAACATPSSWSADVRVTPSSFNMNAAPEARGEFLGDYMGMTTSGLAFQPFFIESGSASAPPPVPTPPTDAVYASIP